MESSLMSPSWMLVSSATSAVAFWIVNKLVTPHPLDIIRGPGSNRWFQGNRSQIWHPTNGIKFMKDITREYGTVVKLQGVFGARELFVSDPSALQSISTNRDPSVWQLPSEVLATNSVLFGEGLPGTTGEIHRQHRKDLVPLFAKTHVQELVPVFYSVARKLRDALQNVVNDDHLEIDLLPWTARTSLELVGQGGLGYSFDNFTDENPDEYASAVKNLLPKLFQNPVARALAPLFPLPLRRFLAHTIPSRSLQELMDIVRVMDKSSRKLLSSRKAALLDRDGDTHGLGRDLVTILLRNNLRDKSIPDSHLLGHINSLIFGAVDTTSSAFSRSLYVLAQYPDVQDRIREEGRIACEQNGTEELEFKTLANLTYTDAFIREVLRLHAPAPALLRRAGKDTILPLKYPILGHDGQKISQVLVPAGTTVFVSLLMPNLSVQIWGDDALEFKPERWLYPLPETVMNSGMPGIYSHIMTFWAGGSACLGFQFALLELKVTILLLLRSFRFSLSEHEVEWRSSGLQFPSVAETGMLALPLKVETL